MMEAPIRVGNGFIAMWVCGVIAVVGLWELAQYVWAHLEVGWK